MPTYYNINNNITNSFPTFFKLSIQCEISWVTYIVNPDDHQASTFVAQDILRIIFRNEIRSVDRLLTTSSHDISSTPVSNIVSFTMSIRSSGCKNANQ